MHALIEKTEAGRLVWEATASEGTFIASVGGETTLKLTLESGFEINPYGEPEAYTVPALSLVAPKGRTLWEIKSNEVKGSLWPLHRLAQRVANKVDERIAALLEDIEKL